MNATAEKESVIKTSTGVEETRAGLASRELRAHPGITIIGNEMPTSPFEEYRSGFES
jgi:hypothetical protein